MIMDPKSDEILTRLRRPIYFIAIGLTVIPLLDFALSILPIDPGNLRWRWSTLGLFTGFLFTPLFAIILVCFVASQLEDRITQRVVSILNLIAAPVLLGMALLYGLDIIQLRADLPESDRLPFYMSAVRALVKYGFAFVCFLWLGIAGFRASRAARTSREARRGEATPLVSGVGSMR
jgi:hypothetical protein